MFGNIGIDVGGTFTDAVLIKGGILERKVKVPTHQEDILQTILNALDCLSIGDLKYIEQITVSTTLVTNSILQEHFPKIDMYLMPGNGMELTSLHWPVPYKTISGEIDYRGREIKPPDELEWRRLIQQRKKELDLAKQIAIVGKFSHRNNKHEVQLASYFRQADPDLRIALGYQWGQANFYRRSLTTFLNLGITDLFEHFITDLERAVAERGCTAPIKILKADGGVLPLRQINPVETIYSGPAASVLGGMAQNDKPSFVIIDIGGTTTDIGIVISKTPLLSSTGAKIGPFSTLVRSLAVRSALVGGDSAILKKDGEWQIANYRLGSAYCLGGPVPTPTDAMCYLGLINIGDPKLAEAALSGLLPPEKREPAEIHHLALVVLEKVADRIAEAIGLLAKEWQEEPAYKIWGVLHPHETQQLNVWASGGGAQGLKSFLEKRLHTEVRVGKHPEVSNAIGAAMSRPSFTCTLHLDTVLNRFQIAETGEQGKWEGSKRPHLEVESFLGKIASRLAAEKDVDISQAQKTEFDLFPVVQGYQTVGQIVQGTYCVPPGVKGQLLG